METPSISAADGRLIALLAGVMAICLFAGCGDNGLHVTANASAAAGSTDAVSNLATMHVVGPQGSLRLTAIGGFSHGQSKASAAEIAAYDAGSRRLFVVNVARGAVDILDIADPVAPRLVASVKLGDAGSPTSVAARRGMIAVSVYRKEKSKDRGRVVFLSPGGEILKSIPVGFGPDMLTFSPDGRWLLVANEGEPDDDYVFDPEGSVSQIDVSRGAASVAESDAATLDFRRFDFDRAALDASVRIFGKGASVAQDLEPEYIAVSSDSKTAWVVCQENNAIGVIDLEAKQVNRLVGLGFKDHSQECNRFDPSDRDDAIRIRAWPVKGMFQPDAMASFVVDGSTFLITANEGDHRAYAGFRENCRVAELLLDPQVFPQAAQLQRDENLGRLQTTRMTGDRNGDGLHDEIYSFGGRSFAIWTSDVKLAFDSGDQFEQIISTACPRHFNSDHETDSFDRRSGNKGPEPEGVAVGVVAGRTFAFIGLERIGGVLVYDVSNPLAPVFDGYFNTRVFGTVPGGEVAGDVGPEGVLWISSEDSPNGTPMLVVCNEVSGTTRLFRVDWNDSRQDRQVSQ